MRGTEEVSETGQDLVRWCDMTVPGGAAAATGAAAAELAETPSGTSSDAARAAATADEQLDTAAKPPTHSPRYTTAGNYRAHLYQHNRNTNSTNLTTRMLFNQSFNTSSYLR